MKLLIGGSPCTYWSIAQTKNRETEASGMGWELFKNFLIARDKYKPDYFLYENNKSMSPAIRAQITKEFGFEPVMIDSALVSAQSRKRLYWLGRREPDGTYSRVNVELPEDRGIILRDILETGVAFREKAYTLDANYYKTTDTFNPKKQRSYSRHQAAEPINTTENGKSQTIKAQYAKSSTANFCCYTSTYEASGVAEAINVTEDGKAYALKAQYSKSSPSNLLCDGGHYPASGAAEMICETTDGQLQLITVGNAPIPLNTTQDGKAQCLRATCYKDGIRNMVGNDVDKRTCVAEPVRIPEYGTENKSRPISASYANKGSGEGSLKTEAFPDNPNKQVFDYVAEPLRIGAIESAAKNPGQDSQAKRVYSPDGKSTTLLGCGGGAGAKTGLYAVPICQSMRVREATKLGYAEIMPGECVDLSMLSSKTRRGRRMSEKSNCLTTSCEFYEYCGTLDKPVYKVKDGLITIKDKQYPIKLRDGCYIIRKLTVTECKRLQTVPEDYIFPVSDTQAYKLLGNGWTIEVIIWLLSHIPSITTEPLEVLSMYDGMSCGHIALDGLGAQIERYYATEIDKYAIQTTMHNYPETVELGDAFQVREDGWRL